ncbi:MAG: ion transporter [Alphaproteobacteria bacterium]|nr:MAG: ion transporter [Alphaproteobacteria bacterium]
MQKLRDFLFSPLIERIIIGLICANALVLGLGTNMYLQENYGMLLDFMDHLFVLVFATEVALKVFLLRSKFFKSGWNVFDFLVVAIPLLSSVRQLSVLRSLRILRVMRLLHFIPRFQIIIDSFMLSLPGIMGIIGLLLVFFYTYAVMGVALFGGDHPSLFGDLGTALFSVFQVATIENWPDIARAVMETHPWSWVYFVALLLTTALTVMNLIISLLLDAVSELREKQKGSSNDKMAELLRDVREIKEKLQQQ